jgi:hypothetical protein
MMQTSVEPQDAEARTVVQGRVLKRPAARDLHVFHVDLNRLSRFRLLEELHLAGFPLAGPPQARQPHVPKDPLNGAHREPDPDDLALDALQQALYDRSLTAGPLVHHSDRGGQYLSIRYTERLAEAGIERSVDSEGTRTTTRWPRP